MLMESDSYGCKERLTWKKAEKVGNYKIQTHKITQTKIQTLNYL